MNVLLVEDNPDDAELTQRALRECDACEGLIHAEDGLQAIQILFCEGEYSGRDPKHLPRIILLDLNLPKLDGMDVLRRLKTDVRTRTVPVVMLSSSSEDRDVRQSYELGVNSYVVKPVAFDEYIRKVSAVGRYWVTISQRCGD